jgi:hypothetical protein
LVLKVLLSLSLIAAMLSPGSFKSSKVDGTKTRPNLLTQILFSAHCDAPTRKEMGPNFGIPHSRVMWSSLIETFLAGPKGSKGSFLPSVMLRECLVLQATHELLGSRCR